MEHRKITGPAGVIPAGHTVLILSGPKGAVTLDAWEHDGQALGELGIHVMPRDDAEGAFLCNYLPGGRCWADGSSAIGAEQAPSILAGYDARAWVLLGQFYRERIDPEEA